ncbi:MAG: hypothetical protein FJ290_27870 [Planctomycetes bacterium]|nr:hypothetical protein [Planctomycetota bacterium]
MSLAAYHRPDMRIRLRGLVDAAAYKGARPNATKDTDGWIEIGFGERRVLERALAGGAPFDFTVENHAAEHNGLLPAGNADGVGQHAHLLFESELVSLAPCSTCCLQ